VGINCEIFGLKLKALQFVTVSTDFNITQIQTSAFACKLTVRIIGAAAETAELASSLTNE